MESRFLEGPTGHSTFTDMKITPFPPEAGAGEEVTAAASIGREAMESLALEVE